MELESTYNSTDLTWDYAVDRFNELSQTKQIAITPQTMAYWFVEFMRRKWTKRIFDSRVVIVREAQVFGRLDIADWLKSERMFPEFELNLYVQEEIARRLQQGEYYAEQLKKGIKLKDDEMTTALLYATTRLKQEYDREKSIAFERVQEEILEKEREKVQLKKEILTDLDSDKRAVLLKQLVEQGIFAVGSSIEFECIVKYLPSYHSLIPDEMLTPFLEKSDGGKKYENRQNRKVSKPKK